MRKKALLLSVASLFVLAGCISTPAPVHVQHFSLSSTKTAHQHTTTASHNQKKPILRIAETDAANWLNSTKLYYRLAYRNGAQVSSYSQSDWIAPPPVLLDRLLQNSLASSGQWQAIASPHDVTHADVTLQVQLHNFAQVFSTQNQSAGVLDATVTLFKNPSNTILGQRHFHIEKPAPSADATGGVKALNDASHAFAKKVQAWLEKMTERDNESAKYNTPR